MHWLDFSQYLSLSILCVSSLSFTAKNPRPCESHDGNSQWRGCERDSPSLWTGCQQTSETLGPCSQSETTCRGPITADPMSTASKAVSGDQDQPLSFDHTKLAVATAAFRGPSFQQGSSQTQSMARVLQSSLPNLINTSLRQTYSAQSRDGANGDGAILASVVGKKRAVRDCYSDCEAVERIPGESSTSEISEVRTGHVLGLDCYSSSDEDCNIWCFFFFVLNYSLETFVTPRPQKWSYVMTKFEM